MKIKNLIARYAIVIILALLFPVFYTIFTPLTLYPVYLILNLFYSVNLDKTTLMINGSSINLIKACIAGSAYFLLAILNFSTPKIRKRFYALAFSLVSFLLVNILRIVILSILFLSDFRYFTETHLVSWYLLTAVFVLLIWLLTIKVFEIKEIPFYSDIILIKMLIKKESFYKKDSIKKLRRNK